MSLRVFLTLKKWLPKHYTWLSVTRPGYCQRCLYSLWMSFTNLWSFCFRHHLQINQGESPTNVVSAVIITAPQVELQSRSGRRNEQPSIRWLWDKQKHVLKWTEQMSSQVRFLDSEVYSFKLARTQPCSAVLFWQAQCKGQGRERAPSSFSALFFMNICTADGPFFPQVCLWCPLIQNKCVTLQTLGRTTFSAQMFHKC